MFASFIASVIAVVALWGFHSSPRNALEQYKRTLRAKGEKLTFAELTAGRTISVNDCGLVISNNLAQLRAFSPGGLALREFVGPGKAAVCWKAGSPLWPPSGGPGWKELGARIDEGGPALANIRAALKKAPADAGPFLAVSLVRKTDFVAMRSAAQWLAAAVIWDLHQGKLEEALQNVEAMGALAGMYDREYTLVAQMIRISLAGFGLAATWEALQAPGWTDPQLERLQRLWEKLDLFEALGTGFAASRAEGEQAFALVHSPQNRQLFSVLRRQPGSSVPFTERLGNLAEDYVWLPIYKLTSIDRDELFFLQTVEQAVNGAGLLKAGRPWAEARQGMAQVTTNLNQLRSSSPGIRFRHAVSVVVLPDYSRAAQRAVQAETERRLTVVAIALERFRKRHGSYPGNLDALVPDLLPAPPADPFTAKPLHYQLRPDGGFLLYSVGEDETDDGGDPNPTSPRQFGMWEGRDVVWPLAAPWTENRR